VIAQEKAAGALATPATADKETDTRTVAANGDYSNSAIAARIKAKLALRGFETRDLEGDAFLVTRWNLARHVPGIRELDQFARMVGA
jgi:hypothetical protein